MAVNPIEVRPMSDNGHQQKQNGHQPEDVRKLLDEGAVLNALRRGVQRELRMHKALGNPIAQNIDGKLVIIPPEEIKIEEPPPPLYSNQGL
jgi:hypothetical protein